MKKDYFSRYEKMLGGTPDNTTDNTTDSNADSNADGTPNGATDGFSKTEERALPIVERYSRVGKRYSRASKYLNYSDDASTAAFGEISPQTSVEPMDEVSISKSADGKIDFARECDSFGERVSESFAAATLQDISATPKPAAAKQKSTVAPAAKATAKPAAKATQPTVSVTTSEGLVVKPLPKPTTVTPPKTDISTPKTDYKTIFEEFSDEKDDNKSKQSSPTAIYGMVVFLQLVSVVCSILSVSFVSAFGLFGFIVPMSISMLLILSVPKTYKKTEKDKTLFLIAFLLTALSVFILIVGYIVN